MAHHGGEVTVSVTSAAEINKFLKQGFEPTTFSPRGVRSTTVPQPLQIRIYDKKSAPDGNILVFKRKN